MYWDRTTLCCKSLWLYIFGNKWLCHVTPPLYSFFFNLHLEVTCSHHLLHLWYREKRHQSRKPLLYYLLFKGKQFLYKNYISQIFITKHGHDHVMKPFNKYFELSLCSDLYLIWWHFTMSPFSTVSLCWWGFMLLYACMTLHVWLFNSCLMSNLQGATYECYVGEYFW